MSKIRIEELLLSDRALLLGHPKHSLSNRVWARDEIRLARDGQAYTQCEFASHYGEKNYEWHWNLGEQCSHACHEQALHKALLRLLKEQNSYIRAWRVLVQPSNASILLRENQLQIVSFLLPIYLVVVCSLRWKWRLETKSKIRQMPLWICG